MPSSARKIPQIPMEQVRLWQVVSVPEHSIAFMHASQVPLRQRLDEQSPPALHWPPFPHLGQDPLQSVSVSSLFLCPSSQLPLTHTSPMQPYDRQSSGAWHVFPSAQDGQDPPQSVSDSVPLRIPSMHEATPHWALESHQPDAQSVATRQFARNPHPGHQEPPQSTSVWL